MTTLYAITEIFKAIYAVILAEWLLTALESTSAPELPESHDREDEGEAKEEVLDRSTGNAGANNRVGVVHDECFSIRAQVSEPPVSQ